MTNMFAEPAPDYRLDELLHLLAKRPAGAFANHVVTVGEVRAMATELLEYRTPPAAA